ncbi:MAG: hypothetical protein LBK26_01005 [Rickettsiales bacterium]|jgi:hypothetical protein|nr:hypothetical protein [Rickettsiales bacterium]
MSIKNWIACVSEEHYGLDQLVKQAIAEGYVLGSGFPMHYIYKGPNSFHHKSDDWVPAADESYKVIQNFYPYMLEWMWVIELFKDDNAQKLLDYKTIFSETKEELEIKKLDLINQGFGPCTQEPYGYTINPSGPRTERIRNYMYAMKKCATQ